MVIDIDRDGNVKIKIYRKHYRKARFLRHAERLAKQLKKDGCPVLALGFERTH